MDSLNSMNGVNAFDWSPYSLALSEKHFGNSFAWFPTAISCPAVYRISMENQWNKFAWNHSKIHVSHKKCARKKSTSDTCEYDTYFLCKADATLHWFPIPTNSNYFLCALPFYPSAIDRVSIYFIPINKPGAWTIAWYTIRQGIYFVDSIK